jgi:hypothetical protein
MNECKRVSDCPADRLAQCRGQAMQDEGDRKLKLAFVEAFRDEDSVRDIAHMADVAMRVVRECRG